MTNTNTDTIELPCAVAEFLVEILRKLSDDDLAAADIDIDRANEIADYLADRGITWLFADEHEDDA